MLLSRSQYLWVAADTVGRHFLSVGCRLDQQWSGGAVHSYLRLLLLRIFPSCGRRNVIEYHSSTLSCLVRPPPLTAHVPYIFYMSISTWLSVFLSVFPGTGASNTILITCPSSLLLTCPYHLNSLFSVIFFVAGATFTDPLTCSVHQFILMWLFIPVHGPSGQSTSDH